MIKNKEFFPVIVFSFSRRECEEYAKQCKKIHFNDEEEAEAVEEVYTNALKCLDEEDRKLPAVQGILPLLKAGIGIHHSGLLPCLKELVEILFSESLVKCLFATETLAMGLNMPANGRFYRGEEIRRKRRTRYSTWRVHANVRTRG